MARKRMIDPGIWESEDFSKLSILARLVWIGLFSNADDAGRGKANPAYIKSQIFAYDEVDLQDIKTALDEIKNTMSINFYEVDGKRYYQLESWDKFQTINRPSPSQIPSKNAANLNNQEQITEYSLNNQEQITDNSLPKMEIEKEIEDKEEVKENTLTSVKESGEPLSRGEQIQNKKHKYGEFKNVLLTEDEYNRLITETKYGVNGLDAIERLSYHRKMTGYKSKDDNLAIRKWCFLAVKEDRQREAKAEQQESATKNHKKESPIMQLQRVMNGGGT